MKTKPREAERLAQMTETESRWTTIAEKQLKGKTIVKVRYMTIKEAYAMGWDQRPVVMQLDDGNLIIPSSDDEGNNAGSLFTQDKTDNILPVI